MATDSAQRNPVGRLEGVKMARVNRRMSIAAALAALAIIVGAGREAKAGLSLSLSNAGIVQVGGGGGGGDPPYTYQFEGQLAAQVQAGIFSSFTVDGLVGVYPFDPTGSEPPGWIYTITPAGFPSWGFPYFTSDVTWTYFGPTITNNGTSPLDLGLFQITTQPNFPAGYPAVLPTSVIYTSSIDGVPSLTSSSIQLTEGGIQPAPEPSTLIAPLVVLLSLPLVRLTKRRVPRGQPTR